MYEGFPLICTENFTFFPYFRLVFYTIWSEIIVISSATKQQILVNIDRYYRFGEEQYYLVKKGCFLRFCYLILPYTVFTANLLTVIKKKKNRENTAFIDRSCYDINKTVKTIYRLLNIVCCNCYNLLSNPDQESNP